MKKTNHEYNKEQEFILVEHPALCLEYNYTAFNFQSFSNPTITASICLEE